MRTYRSLLGICILFILPLTSVRAQGTRADYERAFRFRERFEGLALNIVDRVAWIEGTHRFWYRRSVKGGHEFMLVDAETLVKRPAFDHARLAASLSAATGRSYTATTLPFATLTFVDQERAIEFVALDATWRCTLSDYACRRIGPAPPGPPGGARSRRGIPARVRERCLRWDGLPPSVLPLPPTDAADAPRPTVQSHPIR